MKDSRLQVSVVSAGCTKKMTLANSDELQRRRNGVVERGLSWCAMVVRCASDDGAVVDDEIATVVAQGDEANCSEWCCNGGKCRCRGGGFEWRPRRA